MLIRLCNDGTEELIHFVRIINSSVSPYQSYAIDIYLHNLSSIFNDRFIISTFPCKLLQVI